MTASKEFKGGRRRSAARLAAVQALYEMDLAGAAADPVLRDFLHQRWKADPGQPSMAEPDSELLGRIVRGVSERETELDPLIDAALSGDRTMARLEVLLRATLRAGAYELLAAAEVPAPVVINEYVDVAHAFFDDREAKLVNGVLDRLARTLRAEELGAEEPGAEEPGAEEPGAEELGAEEPGTEDLAAEELGTNEMKEGGNDRTEESR